MPDDVLYRAVPGERDVVSDGAVAEPDQPFGSGGDLRVVGGQDAVSTVNPVAATSTPAQRQPQQVKPDRVIHRLTPAGRAELDRWLSEPAIAARGYRDDFFLKIMAAVRSADPATLPAVLSRQSSPGVTPPQSAGG